MIFVTVGTHEQQFNRLVECMDKWAGIHDEQVVIQTGFSSYIPRNAEWKKLLTYSEMVENVKKARIIITHGGPSSFIMPLQTGKIPIVVPRRKEFEEHVNDHQYDFCKKVERQMQNIIVVDDVKELDEVIEHYDERIVGISGDIASNNDRFCMEFERIVWELI
jgi:UDP-N-acetylglucosamine transferase subunit ALG13